MAVYLCYHYDLCLSARSFFYGKEIEGGQLMVTLKGQSLLGLQGMPKEQIELILRVAKKMKTVVNRDDKKLPYLHGRSIVNLFWEPSTRTRGSFEMAAKYLGADTVIFIP